MVKHWGGLIMTSYADDVIPDGNGKIEVRSCNKLGLFAHEGGICVGADLCVRCNTHPLLCTIGTPEQSQKPLMGVCVLSLQVCWALAVMRIQGLRCSQV